MPRSLAAVLLLFSLNVNALAMDVASRIDSVALYPSGAIVTRVAEVSLPAGTSTVRLTGLVAGLTPADLQLEASSADVNLGQIRFARVQQRDAYNAEVERLNAGIRTLTADIAAINDAVKSAELRLRFLDGVAAGYAKEAWHDSAQGNADIGSWQAALDLLDSASGSAYSEIRRQQAAREDAERDLSVLQRELAGLRGGNLSSSIIEVTLQANRATRSELRMHYLQEEAGWYPQYEARLDSDAGRLQLMQQALIEQGTDEQWDNVRLSLSTSDPSSDLEPGELDPEFLNLSDPVVRAPAQMRSQADGFAADSLEEIVVSGMRKQATVGNFAVTYDIPGRVTIASDADDAQSFDISSFDTGVELVTRVIPRNSAQAFLAARFTYERNEPLYGSELRVYVDGAFAGITEMPTALPGMEVTLPMGADRRVEVRLTDQGVAKGRGGIISREQTETTHYLIDITNRRQSTTRVEVLDRYPTARDRDIEVDIARTSTAPDETNVDEQPGVILWRKSLGADEHWRIQHEYTVTWPAGKRLSRQ